MQERIIEYIKNEHIELIRNFDQLFAKAELAGDRQDWGKLKDYCLSYFENNHHQKEEEFIFATVMDIPQLKAGGPLCTLHFDSYMSQPPIDQVADLVTKLTGQTPTPEWSPLMNQIRNKNLPLVIPGSEHEAGRMLLRAADQILNSNDENKIQENIKKIFTLYREIQTQHFKKEETCFLKMCVDLIPPSEWDKIIDKMRSQYPDI